MNTTTYTYGCFWNDKELEVDADTLYGAQQKAVIEFQKVAGRKNVRGSDIRVMLMRKNGDDVVHVADF